MARYKCSIIHTHTANPYKEEAVGSSPIPPTMNDFWNGATKTLLIASSVFAGVLTALILFSVIAVIVLMIAYPEFENRVHIGIDRARNKIEQDLAVWLRGWQQPTQREGGRVQ